MGEVANALKRARLSQRRYPARGASPSVAEEDCRVLADEVKRLRAIVDKLAKTADDVSVVPNVDNVWCEHEGTIVQSKRILYAELHWLTGSGEKRWWAEFPGGFYRVVDLCSSTREAAEAAKGEGDGKAN